MATRDTDEFRRDAVCIATTNGLAGPYEAAGKENERLRKEVRLPCEEREVLKRQQSIYGQGMFTCLRGFFAGQSPLSGIFNALPGSG